MVVFDRWSFFLARIDCFIQPCIFFSSLLLLPLPFLSFSSAWRDEADVFETCAGSKEPSSTEHEGNEAMIW